jgi:hypothetical protein
MIMQLINNGSLGVFIITTICEYLTVIKYLLYDVSKVKSFDKLAKILS